MTDELALLKAVLADPADDAPRLIFADWLDENGQSERGDFIRIQCAIEERRAGPAGSVSDDSPYLAGDMQYRAWRRRERELLDEHCRDWFLFPGLSAPGFGENEPLCWWEAGDSRGARRVMEGTPRRGFVDSVTCSWRDCAAHLAAVLAAQPLTTVTLTTWPDIERVDVTRLGGPGPRFLVRLSERTALRRPRRAVPAAGGRGRRRVLLPPRRVAPRQDVQPMLSRHCDNSLTLGCPERWQYG